ncbi:MAG: hypothetical protein LKI29_04155 [Bacteroides sp.]|jgi:hypothetical protein|nr:hypothetical protein [Bacteroides sp.]
MTYIDNLLQKRSLSAPTPFWKLNVNNNELSELIDYIRDTLFRFPFNLMSSHERKKQYHLFDREVCLMYALWWSRKYDGGKQSWEEALVDFGISLNYLEIIREAAILELKNNHRLKITVFRSETNHRMFLQSILAQGGLPMQLMNGDNNSSFENFLYYLISEYEDMDYRDWSNITIAEKLADRYLCNKTLRESTAVLDFAMEIVKSYINNDDAVFCNYDEIKDIISHIREKRGSSQKQERKLFKVNWEFQIMGNSLELYYSLSIPHEVIIHDNLNEESNVASIYSYYIDGHLVGSYHRQGDRYLLMPGTSMDKKMRWDRQCDISLQRKIKNELVEDRSLINGEPPYIDEPMLMQYKSGNWVPKQIKNNETYACLIPKDWDCDQLSSIKEYEFEGKIYKWADIDWKSISEQKLVFTNVSTQEELVLDNRISIYSVSFSPKPKDWIEEASSAIIVDTEDIRGYFQCFKEDGPCSKNGFKFMYKSEADNKYKTYVGGQLPVGPIVMKVFYPADGGSKTFSFYNITGLKSERISNDTIRLSFMNGKYALMANQNINKISDNEYQVANTNNLSGFAPIRFRLYPANTDTTIDIGIKSPFQMSCFIDSKGNILSKDYPIAICELYKYKINLSEKSSIIISYLENRDGYETCVTRKTISFLAGKYPIDIIKEDIDRLVCINGFNDYKKHITIKIKNSNSEICVRRNAYKAKQCESETGKKGVIVTRNNNPVSDLTLYAIAVNAPEDSILYHNEIKLEELENTGTYFVPEQDEKDAKEFVVFSDNNLNEGNMLACFLNLGENMDKEQRDANKRESINRIQERLKQGNEDEWNSTWYYMDLVIKYRLSYFNTFNTFFAIANNPGLLASLLVRITSSELIDNYGEETVVDELQRMERELSFAFHYLPSHCWKNEYCRIQELYNTIALSMPSIKETLGNQEDFVDKSFYLLDELLKKQFGDDEQYLPIKFQLLGCNWPNKPSFLPREREYLMKVNDALEDFDRLYTPEDLRFVRVEYHPLKAWNHYQPEEIMQKMQYMAIILPQCAAQYAHGTDLSLWEYNPENSTNEFIRRMINYMRIYASEAYNTLFTTSILRDAVNQDNN